MKDFPHACVVELYCACVYVYIMHQGGRVNNTKVYKINPSLILDSNPELTWPSDKKIEPLSKISSEITKSVVEKATGHDFKRITDCQRIKGIPFTISIELNTYSASPFTQYEVESCKSA